MQLDQLVQEVGESKQEYVEKLTSLDLNIVREAAAKAATKVVADKFEELTNNWKPSLLRGGRNKR
jgi:hypothetical protein